MVIVSIREIKSLEDFRLRIKKVKEKYKTYPDFIIFETTKVLNQYSVLMSGKKVGRGAFCNYSFIGIPLIILKQTRI